LRECFECLFVGVHLRERGESEKGERERDGRGRGEEGRGRETRRERVYERMHIRACDGVSWRRGLLAGRKGRGRRESV